MRVLNNGNLSGWVGVGGAGVGGWWVWEAGGSWPAVGRGGDQEGWSRGARRPPKARIATQVEVKHDQDSFILLAWQPPLPQPEGGLTAARHSGESGVSKGCSSFRIKAQPAGESCHLERQSATDGVPALSSCALQYSRDCTGLTIIRRHPLVGIKGADLAAQRARQGQLLHHLLSILQDQTAH